MSPRVVRALIVMQALTLLAVFVVAVSVPGLTKRPATYTDVSDLSDQVGNLETAVFELQTSVRTLSSGSGTTATSDQVTMVSKDVSSLRNELTGISDNLATLSRAVDRLRCEVGDISGIVALGC